MCRAIGLGGIERAFGERDADRRLPGEPRGEACALRISLVVVDRLPDEAPFGGALGGKRLGENRQRARPRRADQPRQKPGAAAIGDEADRAKTLG